MGNGQSAHVLLVEDEPMIALDVESLLEGAGYTVTWCSTIDDAIQAVRREDFDAAILDVNLRGQHVTPVADALHQAKVPFILCSGHSGDMMPERHRHAPFITKPYEYRSLLAALRAVRLMKAV